MSKKWSSGKIEKLIKRLSRSYENSTKRENGRFGFYTYLDEIYCLFASWRRTPGLATNMRDRIAKFAKLRKVTRNMRTFHVIIAATSRETKRTQSRWSQALRYAWKYRQQRGKLSLADFFKKNGGPAGCARKLSLRIAPEL